MCTVKVEKPVLLYNRFSISIIICHRSNFALSQIFLETYLEGKQLQRIRGNPLKLPLFIEPLLQKVLSQNNLWQPGVGEEFAEEWIHVYERLSRLCCSPESISTLFISYTPKQNKEFFKSLNDLRKFKTA